MSQTGKDHSEKYEPEVPRGDDKAYVIGRGMIFAGTDEGKKGCEVISYLGQNSRPVNGIDGAEPLACIYQGVGEEGFHEILLYLVKVLSSAEGEGWCT